MTKHPAIAAFSSIDGQLAVGGQPLRRLAERVGSTPFFAYDRSRLNARVASLRAALPDQINLSYAVKANPMPAVVQHLAGLLDAKVKITLEIEADMPSGAPENVVRTVTENCRTLKFDSQGFEEV